MNWCFEVPPKDAIRVKGLEVRGTTVPPTPPPLGGTFLRKSAGQTHVCTWERKCFRSCNSVPLLRSAFNPECARANGYGVTP